MTVVVFLNQPWCGSVARCFGTGGFQSNTRILRQWALHPRGQAWCNATHGAPTEDALAEFVSSQGFIHGLALCDSFTVKDHHGQLHTPEQRVLRDYMFFARRRCLQELMFSHIDKLFVFDKPVQVPVEALLQRGAVGAGARHDVVMLDVGWLSNVGTTLLDSEGNRVQCGDLLERLSADVDTRVYFATHNDRSSGWQRPCSGRCVGLQLPLQILHLVIEKKWFDVVIDVQRQGTATLKHMAGNVLPDLNQPVVANTPHISFDSKMFTAAAQLIRGQPLAEDEALNRNSILKWLDDMADSSAMGLDHLMIMAGGDSSKEKKHGFKMEGLIRTILLCGHLRGDAALAPAVHDTGVLLGFNPGWLSDSSARLPGRSTVQRHRFTLDAALCVAVRQKFQVVFVLF